MGRGCDGGTGITPFYQLLHKALLGSTRTPSSTRFTLLHSSRVPNELPPSELLQPLIKYAQTDPEHLRLLFFVDQKDGSNAEAVPLNQISEGRIGIANIHQALGDGSGSSWWQKLLRVAPVKPTQLAEKKVLFLVCGPEPMINAIAGPYGRNYSQGPVGGALRDLGCRPDQVWKL